MQFAHTLGEGGPEIEFLIVAAAMLVLGIVFFVQKSVKPVVSVVLVVGAFAMGVGAFAAGGNSSDSAAGGGCGSLGSNGDTSVTVVTPSDGDVVPAGEPVALDIALEGATGDAEGGHFDVSVDDQLETMSAQSDPEVTFAAGEHELRVEYVTSQHQSFDPPVFAIVCVTAE